MERISKEIRSSCRWPWSLASSHHARQQNIALGAWAGGAYGVARRAYCRDANFAYHPMRAPQDLQHLRSRKKLKALEPLVQSTLAARYFVYKLYEPLADSRCSG
jgi:hypothetical protein